MTLTIIGGLALWFLAGCIVATILCLIFKAAEPRREGERRNAPDHAAHGHRVGADNFTHETSNTDRSA